MRPLPKQGGSTLAQKGDKSTDNWKGRWILTAGLGGMGGAQPLAATLQGRHRLTLNANSQALIFVCVQAMWISRQTT